MEKYSLYSHEAGCCAVETINLKGKEFKSFSRQPVKRPHNHSVKESS